ncbi:MAG: hypothetical protein EAS49_13360 [Brucella intermedia]|nr:MAG: hypothetical protein EAS49_13360 [Brucella intermedia]
MESWERPVSVFSGNMNSREIFARQNLNAEIQMPRLLHCMAGHFSLALPVNSARPVKTKLPEPPELFVSPHYPAHRSGLRNQSSELISPRRRFALLLEML